MKMLTEEKLRSLLDEAFNKGFELGLHDEGKPISQALLERSKVVNKLVSKADEL